MAVYHLQFTQNFGSLFIKSVGYEAVVVGVEFVNGFLQLSKLSSKFWHHIANVVSAFG